MDMQVEYRPIGKNRWVVGVMEVVNGVPGRTVSIRKYIRMIQKGRASPAGGKLKPLKNLLREYLAANPEFAVFLRFKDAPGKKLVHVTDGRFVLKQLTLDELEQCLRNNEQFIGVVAYRQIARQTENYKAHGTTQGPRQAAAASPAPGPSGGVLRNWLNDHPKATLALTAMVLASCIAAAVVLSLRGPGAWRPADPADSPALNARLSRYEAALRHFDVLAQDDPEAARMIFQEMRRFADRTERESFDAVQAKRLDAIREQLPELQDVTKRNPRP